MQMHLHVHCIYLELFFSRYGLGGSVVDGHGMSRETMFLLKLGVKEIESYTKEERIEWITSLHVTRKIKRGILTFSEFGWTAINSLFKQIPGSLEFLPTLKQKEKDETLL